MENSWLYKMQGLTLFPCLDALRRQVFHFIKGVCWLQVEVDKLLIQSNWYCEPEGAQVPIDG